MSDPTDTNLLDLTGRIALITGAGQGVGAATARSLAAHGAKVVVNDYFVERAEEVATSIGAAGGAAIAAQGDVTNFDSMEHVVARAAEAFGPISVLVNNAGNAGAEPAGDGFV